MEAEELRGSWRTRPMPKWSWHMIQQMPEPNNSSQVAWRMNLMSKSWLRSHHFECSSSLCIYFHLNTKILAYLHSFNHAFISRFMVSIYFSLYSVTNFFLPCFPIFSFNVDCSSGACWIQGGIFTVALWCLLLCHCDNNWTEHCIWYHHRQLLSAKGWEGGWCIFAHCTERTFLLCFNNTLTRLWLWQSMCDQNV